MGSLAHLIIPVYCYLVYESVSVCCLRPQLIQTQLLKHPLVITEAQYDNICVMCMDHNAFHTFFLCSIYCMQQRSRVCFLFQALVIEEAQPLINLRHSLLHLGNLLRGKLSSLQVVDCCLRQCTHFSSE